MLSDQLMMPPIFSPKCINKIDLCLSSGAIYQIQSHFNAQPDVPTATDK